MAAITGRKTYLKLNGTNISTWCDNVQSANNTEELDGTTFQPDVTIPQKLTLYGFNDKRYTVTGKWIPAVEDFFNGASGVDGSTDLEYVYGPQGHAVGQTRIAGEANVGKYSGPQSSINGVTTFTFELALNTQDVDTFDGGSPT